MWDCVLFGVVFHKGFSGGVLLLEAWEVCDLKSEVFCCFFRCLFSNFFPWFQYSWLFFTGCSLCMAVLCVCVSVVCVCV